MARGGNSAHGGDVFDERPASWLDALLDWMEGIEPGYRERILPAGAAILAMIEAELRRPIPAPYRAFLTAMGADNAGLLPPRAGYAYEVGDLYPYEPDYVDTLDGYTPIALGDVSEGLCVVDETHAVYELVDDRPQNLFAEDFVAHLFEAAMVRLLNVRELPYVGLHLEPEQQARVRGQVLPQMGFTEAWFSDRRTLCAASADRASFIRGFTFFDGSEPQQRRWSTWLYAERPRELKDALEAALGS